MSIRRITCPKCKSPRHSTEWKGGGPSSLAGNEPAIFTCEDCAHRWEGSATRPETLAKMRRRGWRI